MNYSGIQWESIVDGPGLRNTLFVSGCIHKCNGCHNPDTWNFNNGNVFDEEVANKLIEDSKNNPLIKGLTISGGDPFCSAKEMFEFVKKYRVANPTHDIWIYSGYTFEELITDKDQLDLLYECDTLVDGKFELDKKDISLQFRGSSNQRIINIKETIKKLLEKIMTEEI